MKLIENTWAPFQVAPQWVFSNLTNFMQGNATTLNGQVSDAQNPGADSRKDYRYWAYSAYIDDQWKVSRKLTLNVGLRYSPTSIIKSAKHEQFNLINAPFGQWQPVKQSTAVNPSLRNIDPRVGLAWDPFDDHKTSIRAGFGVFHSVLYSRDTNHWLQPPFLTVAQTTTSLCLSANDGRSGGRALPRAAKQPQPSFQQRLAVAGVVYVVEVDRQRFGRLWSGRRRSNI
jgi:hypothetical protein